MGVPKKSGLVLLLGLVISLIFSATFAAALTLDFVGVTSPSSTHVARYDIDDGIKENVTNIGTEFNTTMYGAISTSDDNYVVTRVYHTYDYAQQIFRFKVDVPIKTFNVTWEGNIAFWESDGRHAEGIEIWNNATNSWEWVDTVSTVGDFQGTPPDPPIGASVQSRMAFMAPDETISKAYVTNVDNYIENGYITLLVWGKNSHCATVCTDYVKLDYAPYIPPVACFTVSNESPNVCETVTFNASCSHDPDGTIVKYEWDWDGDCTYDFDAGSNPIATHHYDTHGTYSPKLRVTDDDDLSNETQTTILVRGHPVADFDWTPPDPQECETITFDASASTPDGGHIISYAWDFDDGIQRIFVEGVNLTDTTTHHFDWRAGGYDVTLTVTDNETKSDSITKNVYVRGYPIADFTWGPTAPLYWETVSFDGSASIPRGGTITTWKWDFNDGVTTIEGDPFTTHDFMPGTYNVTLTIDDDEQKSDSTWHIVTVGPSVGGKTTPINIPVSKPELQIPWIWLLTIIIPLIATVVFVKLKKKKK